MKNSWSKIVIVAVVALAATSCYNNDVEISGRFVGLN